MRVLLLVLAGLCIFTIVAAIGVKVTPEPLKESDYMVIGSVATLVALMVLFVVHISTSKSSNVFFRRRKK
jgi:amino acid permease